METQQYVTIVFSLKKKTKQWEVRDAAWISQSAWYPFENRESGALERNRLISSVLAARTLFEKILQIPKTAYKAVSVESLEDGSEVLLLKGAASKLSEFLSEYFFEMKPLSLGDAELDYIDTKRFDLTTTATDDTDDICFEVSIKKGSLKNDIVQALLSFGCTEKYCNWIADEFLYARGGLLNRRGAVRFNFRLIIGRSKNCSWKYIGSTTDDETKRRAAAEFSELLDRQVAIKRLNASIEHRYYCPSCNCYVLGEWKRYRKKSGATAILLRSTTCPHILPSTWGDSRQTCYKKVT